MRARPSCDGRRTALTGACCLGRSANKARARLGQRRATAPAVGPGGCPVNGWTCAGDAMELSDAMRAQARLRRQPINMRLCGTRVIWGWDVRTRPLRRWVIPREGISLLFSLSEKGERSQSHRHHPNGEMDASLGARAFP